MVGGVLLVALVGGGVEEVVQVVGGDGAEPVPEVGDVEVTGRVGETGESFTDPAERVGETGELLLEAVRRFGGGAAASGATEPGCEVVRGVRGTSRCARAFRGRVADGEVRGD